jgi:hypothetical protein
MYHKEIAPNDFTEAISIKLIVFYDDVFLYLY